MKKRSQLPRSERPEKKAMNGQLRSMSERDLLAVILGSGVSGSNVKQIATTLIRKFGEDLLTADALALCQVKGMGEVKAARLAAAFELYRKLCDGTALRPIKTPEDAYWICQDLATEKQEVLGYLALDVRNRLLERVDLYKGNETLSVADPKHIFRTALGKGAQAIVIYHNHPSGSLDLSTHDRDLARRLVEAGKLLNLPLLDFIIVARQGYFSLREEHIQGEGLSWAAEPGIQLTLWDVLLPQQPPRVKPASPVDATAARDALYDRFAERLEVNPLLTRQLVSFQRSKTTPFYRWLKFKEAFSPDLVDYLFDAYAMQGCGDVNVLDPFAGTGTVLTRACVRQWHATGIELLPVGTQALKARLLADSVDLSEFDRALDQLHGINWTNGSSTASFPHLRITQDAFSPTTEKQISLFLKFADGIEDREVGFLFRFACMSVLEDVSYTRKDGQYLRWDHRSGREHSQHFDKGPVPQFSKAITSRLGEIRTDLAKRNGGSFSRNVKIIEGSCLYELPKLPAETFDRVVTSPPYCNRYDYTRTYALELAYLGCGEEDIRRLRQTLLSATVENRSKRQQLQYFYDEIGTADRFGAISRALDGQAALHEVLEILQAARERGELSNNNVPNLIENYFVEMAVVVFELARVLKPGGHVLMVNDNVRYQGEEVPVDLILSDFAEAAGLVTDRIWVLPRGKGNSSQQMGKWGRVELRKCVYSWRKP
jgi:DNA repair protein RadC